MADFLRAIKNLHNRESCVPIFKEHRIMTLPNLYILLPNGCQAVFSNLPNRQETHSYPTRKISFLETIPIRLEKLDVTMFT